MRAKDAEWLRMTSTPITMYDSHDTPSVCRVIEEDCAKAKLEEIEQEFAALQAENEELKSKVKMAEGYFKMREALLEGVEMEALDADIAKAVSINWYDLLMTSDTSNHGELNK